MYDTGGKHTSAPCLLVAGHAGQLQNESGLQVVHCANAHGCALTKTLMPMTPTAYAIQGSKHCTLVKT